MPPKAEWEEGEAQEGDESLSAMLDPDLETEVELDAALSPRKTADSDSVKSKSEPTVKKEVQELYDLVESRARVQALTNELSELKGRLESKKAAEEEEDLEFDSGDVPEDYSAKDMKSTLDRSGTVLAKEIARKNRELKTEIQALREELTAKIRNEVVAARVRTEYGITKEKEDKIIAWAEEMGVQYDSEKQLAAVIRNYSKIHDGEEKEERKVQSSPNPRVRPTAQSAAGKAKPAKPRTFDERMVKSFQDAKRSVIDDLKAGKLRI